MSENILIRIEPAEIKAWAQKHLDLLPTGVAHVLLNAGDAYAGMAQEVDYRLIPAEKNGGKYGHRKWVRYVSEWQPDE